MVVLGELAGETVTWERLATAALDPSRTDAIFAKYERLILEICARWISSGEESEAKISAFGRIIPFAPYLGEHVERFLASVSTSAILGDPAARKDARQLDVPTLLSVLLGTFRLLSFDCRTYARYVRPLVLQSLFTHENRVVRCLAIRTFCLYVHAADNATQSMIKRYLGEQEITGPWEDQTIDYRFLSLWEERRWNTLRTRLSKRTAQELEPLSGYLEQHLSPYSVNVNGVLLPCLDGSSSTESPAQLVPAPTTQDNLQRIATGLLGSSPLLLTGLAGSGKTLLVRHLAWRLNKLESMVTLHLNEQSDAKLLVGMYATGAKPGTFTWRPGVLTTAVKEGRWIFIEDLDRAPNDVISTLLPLIERGELLIPSRGETIRAARGFRIIATMRSTLNPRGHEIIPRQNMIGYRFWNSVAVRMAPLEEFAHIITIAYPTLKGHVSGIMRVYSRLLQLFSDPRFASENGTSLRASTPRDLLKWCDRIAVLLSQSSSFTSAQVDDMFMEALDCFAGSLRSETSRATIMACVAEELHIDPQRRDHLLSNRTIKLEVPGKTTAAGTIRIGRVRLSKHRSSRQQMSGRPFSTNDYTLRLLEKVAVAVDRQEPLLLVGETGTGKTTCIQYLAEQLGRKLVAFNLSQQSESGDLLGGYKPVNVRSLVIPLKDEFDDLFDTTFSRKKNLRFLEMLGKRIAKGEWKRACMLWREAMKMVDTARKAHASQTSSPDPDGGQPKKKRKVDSLPANFPKARWEKFAADLHDLEAQLASGSEAFAFAFLEGNIVKAVRNGDWVLLDEINLASSDTLEALTDLLGGGPDGTPSLLLTETGSVERVVAHPNFRVFAAMNPATDVGKKDLPPGIRSRFTELYVESPDNDVKSLRNIVEKYLGGDSNDPAIIKAALDVTKLYLEIQRLAKANMLVDGADQKPHFSLRTLTRTLSYAREIAPLCTLRRALYEGFQMSFLTFLDKASEDRVAPLIKQHLFNERSAKSELNKPLQQPGDGRSYVRQGHYWLRQGVHLVEDQPHYIITPFVQRNMNNLIRAASTRRYPVLIQGPTSSGKTSMIEYLAKRSGNKFVRINNHEHTDLQEYLGSYISGADGKLSFQEGILVRALREGHWIVLDELNLAPTDVLEALNRLLDDNRELLIPETQEVVRPHPDFMLFATQNPAGLYGGRKVLSRAFRNRFLELHFDDIPDEELTEILHRRTMIPESWCKKIVKVYQELSTLRQENRIFEQKSFATLRDLFRWAQRKADTIQDLAANGYMLLAERVRKEEERQAVKKIIESVMSRNGPRVVVDDEKMYSPEASPETALYNSKIGESANVVWTRAMRRLYVLVAHAIRNNEPVLLVGETGCGKTTVCQMLADAFGKQLHIVNAHQNTETGDLIGAQRPIRNRAAVEDLLLRQVQSVLEGLPDQEGLQALDLAELLVRYDKLGPEVKQSISQEHRDEIQANRVKAAALFEWADGSLVHAMKTGQYFLLDEISLADDSVLERLNSVLESGRTLLLAEKGPIDSLVTATEGFQFLATMNPGGDYGKKELSPALRNRFTEIWVPALSDIDDILQIVRSKLKPSASQFAGSLVSFSQWFNEKYNTSVASSISIRDTLAWVNFINQSESEDPVFAVVHGAAMVFIDTLGANPAGLLAISQASIEDERRACLHYLTKPLGRDVSPLYFGAIEVAASETSLQLGSFSVPRVASNAEDPTFSLEAPTTRSNAMRVVRALQLAKPILLEGNPGVGKTTLVTAIARAVGKPLTRLNLSEQTDLMDLFGSDVPVEGGQAGTFAWRDAPFLKAMKKGDWVLLDEMNLASQSVLEGLNAVLDHRGEVYISELDQTFHKHPNFRVFAAQNPHHQGGGRKGLPASFVNRFTVVYADIFKPEDLELICAKVFSHIDSAEVKKLINFVAALDEEVVGRRAFGVLGSPWEFNLRDTLRWIRLLGDVGTARDFLDAVFVQRFRSEHDRQRLLKLFTDVYGEHEVRMTLYHNLGLDSFQVGLGLLERNPALTRPNSVSHLRVPQLAPMEALMISVKQNWPVILVGPPGSGKTVMINQLASFVGADLAVFAMNADVDAMDLVGGYEQVDPSRAVERFRARLEKFVRRMLATSEIPSAEPAALLEILETQGNMLTENVHVLLTAMASPFSPEETRSLLDEYAELHSQPQQIEGARFQWVDGLLIQALEQGKWLVLDNANLCSSAVLDRLNSLLEPNGYLSINEHATSDGEARIVRPHPDFRIFLTMDPRFGELSRAMRNRAIEVFLMPEVEVGEEKKVPQYPLESTMYRFRHFERHGGDVEMLEKSFEHLSFADDGLSSSFSTDSETKMELQRFFKGWSPNAQAYMAGLGLEKTLPVGRLSDMPYHPLANELCVRSNVSTANSMIWLASCYDLARDIFNMQTALDTLPSSRFERRKEKRKLPEFLQTILELLTKLSDSLRTDTGIINQSDAFALLRPLQTLFWAFLQLAQGQGFDRATFQTLLKMMDQHLKSLKTGFIDFARSLQVLTEKRSKIFGTDVHLTTGLGMERIWRDFRPDTPRTADKLSAILQLESLADRLDNAMWKLSLRADEMIQIRERFASALVLAKREDVDATELVVNLEGAVRELEGRIDEEDLVAVPYFEAEFEALCQFQDLLNSSPGDASNATGDLAMVRAKSSLFARRPTKSLTSAAELTPSVAFEHLYGLAGLHSSLGRDIVLQGRFHVSMLDRIHHADEVQLAQLDRFESELQILAQALTLESNKITERQNNALGLTLKYMAGKLAWAYCTSFGFVQPSGSTHSFDLPEAYRDSLLGQFERYLDDYSKDNTETFTTAQAWIDFAIAGLLLYVPNYPHDPALLPMIERRLFNERKTSLQQALRALKTFQVGFTGQDTSVRIRQVETEITGMGREPPVPAIVRPEVSQLDGLQGEFTNLLSALQPLANGTMTTLQASQESTLRSNIMRIISRLVEGYRNYDDITGPAVGFLICLHIGLTLGAQIQKEDTDVHRSLQYITHHTPFFGLREGHAHPTAETLYASCEQELDQARHAIDLRWHALRSLSLVRTVEPAHLSEQKTRLLIHNVFLSLYSDWKTKLLQDQEKEAQDRSLYTFKGDDGEEEEEDPSLFPDYEKEQEGQVPEMSTTADHIVNVANIHAELFVEQKDGSDVLKRMLEWCSAEFVRVSDGAPHGTAHENAMTPILLALEKKSKALSQAATGRHYNFYFDANLAEAKRFIALIHRIQARYRQIRSVWPEHATLSDVLRTCDEALEFRHVDPVAKFITKAEKLYGYMHEWQRAASREFSTAPLFEEMTKLLVSWRQLELTTWARLFDIEMEKCRDHAKGWFFVAYETIIAAPENIQDEVEMKTHAKDLLKALEGFFSNTTLGQFEQRMKLLEQLREHLAMRSQDVEAFAHVHRAIDNFIAYFSRLAKPVQEAIAKGRQSLEKDVNNVIKLASWKDTNIEALKQSAKTSHRKLSKLVRKFRALLNQPLSGILRAGFSEESFTVTTVGMPDVETTVSPDILEICDAGIPAWNDRPTRFKNLSFIVSHMRNLSSPAVDVLDGAKYIETFITDLESSIVELQKATPSVLSEENKEIVQHLKTQKRKLYADTMKELRAMGIQPNLSVDVLARQDELSTVLARLPNEHVDKRAEYFLYKSLSIMTQVREIQREHSGDLTANDVARSVGFIEGLLNAAIRQRGVQARAKETVEASDAMVAQFENLCGVVENAIDRVPQEKITENTSLRSQIAWLAVILKTGAQITAAQAHLGKTIEFGEVVSGLQEWSATFKDLTAKYDQLPVLPKLVWSDAQTRHDEEVRQKLFQFQQIFKMWMEKYPLPRAVLKQMTPYVESFSGIQDAGQMDNEETDLEGHTKELFASLDLILGAIQDVQAALTNYPESEDDASWLVKEEQALSSAITALHTRHITEALQTILDNIHSLPNSALKPFAAMLTATKPILTQYLTSTTFLTSKFSELHLATTKLTYRLAKSFIQVGTQGFCTPAEKSTDQSGKDDKLESGTGLGEGEGAEDISKDIEDDEDLEDLAAEQGEREGSIEEEEDAVDMGEQEMEGQMNDVAEKEDEDGEGEEGEEDAESEVGSVDDLGPSAVDEKMWDEGGKEDEGKEKEGQQDVGTENQEEQVAAEESKERKEKEGEEGEEEQQQKEGEDEDEEMQGEDQEENVGAQETEVMDPHAKEEETLDLPDELNLEGDENDEKDDDMGDMDMGEEEEEDMEPEAGAQPDTVDEEIGPEEEGKEDEETTGHTKDDEEMGEEEQQDEGEESVDDDVVDLPDEQAQPEEARDAKDLDASDPNADAGAGADANDEAHQNQENQASASAANREEGAEGEESENKQETTAENGSGQTTQPDAGSRGEEPEDSPETQSFKKLGDVLEKWYNQQRQISDSREKDETQVQQMDKEIDMADADFEHVADEESKGDTQALGTATEEQAKTLDQDMAMAVDEEEKIAARPEDNEETVQDEQQDVEMGEAEPAQQEEEQQPQPQGDGQPQGAFVGEQKPFTHLEDEDMEDAHPASDDDISDTSSIASVETKLDQTHISGTLPTPDAARALWLQHESSTHSLSQQLTEHLRLILAPTLATKLRGDFRTGKRLNLKRIIPYIASGYKRDKIWLRRSMPSKRNYQVLIALDDSKSMKESGASDLALKTLTLVTRSLAMLEVGEVSVVGFGDAVNVAHDFDKPFTSDAGVRVFEQFGFEAQKTNVRGVVERSLGLFEEARRKGSQGSEELWQLMLIVSDGICDSHAEIQRLVRRAQEERVMIVFVIVDATAGETVKTEVKTEETAESSGAGAGAGGEHGVVKTEDKKTSILDLQSVEISNEGKIVRWKYMERFPFRYYLVVRDVRELPGVLAGALRQWFGEIAGSA
ncbi:midasin [Sporormia fimetaria CBS 119925]|uniref:Midasin n=1 Tax=Sporormia fimetaria CBS 119925 TaxID=1340428 RepID=A0A6A6VKF8_9PLEO|nr:midasin [Sporormia fimetaria CBS 119925]